MKNNLYFNNYDADASAQGPRALQAACRLSGVAGITVGLLFTAAILLCFWGSFFAPTPDDRYTATRLAAILMFLALAVQVHWIVRRTIITLRASHENDYRMCLKCGYVLSNMGASGKCPECGEPFDIEVNRVLWQCAYRFSYSMRAYRALQAWRGYVRSVGRLRVRRTRNPLRRHSRSA